MDLDPTPPWEAPGHGTPYGLDTAMVAPHPTAHALATRGKHSLILTLLEMEESKVGEPPTFATKHDDNI